jgi:phage-related minor tail protein
MESIDDLLAEVKAEYQAQDLGLQAKKQHQFQEEKLTSQPAVPSPQQPSYDRIPNQPDIPNWVSTAQDKEIAQVRAEFEEQDRAEGLKRQQQQREEQLRKEQQLREEQLRVEQRRQRQREALSQEAIEWLKNLNPHSEEGLWFEEFAYAYPSKLEAAIDYLQALRETHR